MSYEKFVWVELMGFDNTKSDFGVREYIKNAGFVPGVVSLLLSSVDFVHQHEPAARDVTFPPDICSYGGRLPCDSAVRRPPWTKKQLEAFIREFHGHGAKVFFAVFDVYLNDKFHSEWVGNHREALATRRTGEKINSINPLLRLKDGSFYDDFFAAKLDEVLRDYDFDGYHCADGCNHLRFPLYWSDYSDDMVDQFVQHAGVRLPRALAGACNGKAVLMERRADWIWRHQRAGWIGFYVGRWEEHCRKVFGVVHKTGKQVMFNTSWTRDPLEAIYRYGIDYRRIAKAGVDWFVVETVGAGNEIGAEGVAQPGFFHKIAATLLLTRAGIPKSRILSLHVIHDVNENFEVLRHVPTLLEREAYTYPNLFLLDGRGAPRRCVDGFLASLASDLERDEWRWLRENWTGSFSSLPKQVGGVTLVWSEETLAAELVNVTGKRAATTHHLLHRLLANGAPIYSVVDVRHIDKARGPLVVLNPSCFSAAHLRRISACRNGAVIMIGRKDSSAGKPAFQWKDSCRPDPLTLSVYGAKPMRTVLPWLPVVGEDKGVFPKDLSGIEEPVNYFTDLCFRQVSDAFLNGCARVITELAVGARLLNDEPVHIMTAILKEGTVRLFIGNNQWWYAHPQIEVGKTIRSIKVVTRFPYKPITPTSLVTDDTKADVYKTKPPTASNFMVRVPPKGIVVLDIVC